MNRFAIIAVVVAALLGLTGWQGYRLGAQHEIAKSAAALLAANAANTEKQKSLIKGVEKVAQDAEIERTKIESELANADLALERLQQTVRDANAHADTGATSIADARAARTQLANCAAKYRDVAKRADQLRATVLGLQAYTRTIVTE